jgi:hypothetical protein
MRGTRKGEEGLVAGKRGLHDACHPRWPPPISAPPHLDPRAKQRLKGERDPHHAPFGHGLQADPPVAAGRRWTQGKDRDSWLALRQTHVALGNFHIPI